MTSSKVLTAFVGFFHSECYWFTLVGKFYALYVAYKVLTKLWHWTRLYLLSPALDLGKDVKSFGKWAIVTGATDGIGKSYAEQLAKKGMSIVLISRSSDKLAKVAKEIEEKYKDIETKCIVADFSQDISIYDKINDQIKDLDIGVLVNNVGTSFEYPEYLESTPDSDLKQIIVVNCFSVVFMTKLVIPKMAEKKKGLIINLASLSGHISCPLLSVYSGSKAFVYRFSRGLECEVKSKGITVQCVSPCYVATNMSRIKKASFLAPFPDTFVSSALATVGLKSHVYGCFSHDLQKTCIDFIGDCATDRLSFKFLKSFREKCLAKKDKSQ